MPVRRRRRRCSKIPEAASKRAGTLGPCIIMVKKYRRSWRVKRFVLFRFACSLSLSLSLSHTHSLCFTMGRGICALFAWLVESSPATQQEHHKTASLFYMHIKYIIQGRARQTASMSAPSIFGLGRVSVIRIHIGTVHLSAYRLACRQTSPDL